VARAIKQETTMGKFLTRLFSLAVLVFVTTGANATTALTQQQVKDQCGSQTDGKGYSYCQKSCAGGNTCEFGCGPKGCGGTCLTCKGAAMQTTIIHNTIKPGAGVLVAPGGADAATSKGKVGTPSALSNPNLLQGGGAGTTTSSKIKLPTSSTGPTVPPSTGPTIPTR
jgi:hypothetical protein